MSDTSRSGILALTGTLICLSIATVTLRFYARIRTRTPCLADDWVMLVAVVSFLAASVVVFLLVHFKALGYSTFQIPAGYVAENREKTAKLKIALDFTTIMNLACTKISAMLFYKRILDVPGPGLRIFRTVIVSAVAVVLCWLFTFELLAGLQCHDHFSALWQPELYKQYCTISWKFLYGLFVSDFLLDVFVVLLPIPNILHLHMTTSNKIRIICIFALACICVGASLARMVVYIQINHLGEQEYTKVDSQHVETRLGFYYVLECGCSIVAINLPSLWPFVFDIHLGKIMQLARSVTSLISLTSNRSNGIKTSPLELKSYRNTSAETMQAKGASENIEVAREA